MGRKRRKPNVDAPPIFCYYCDRTFKTEAILVNHQREKHLACPTCHRRLTSINGLTIHCSQVHKRTLTAVPNAMPGRESLDVDVFGMDGIPPSFLQSKMSNNEPATKTIKTADYTYQQPSAYYPQQYQYPQSFDQHHSSQQAYNNYYPSQQHHAPRDTPAINPLSSHPSHHYSSAAQPYQPRSQYYEYPRHSHPIQHPPTTSRTLHSTMPAQRAVSRQVQDEALPVVKISTDVTTEVNNSTGSGREEIVYKDLNVSPEEMRARLPKYARDSGEKKE